MNTEPELLFHYDGPEDKRPEITFVRNREENKIYITIRVPWTVEDVEGIPLEDDPCT